MSIEEFKEKVLLMSDRELIELLEGSANLSSDECAAAKAEAKERGLNESAPLLYSRRAIYVWSVLFSVVFGAIMMALNLRELKKPEGIVPTISLSIGYLAICIIIFDYLKSHVNTELPNGYIVSVLGGWLILALVWNKFIGKRVKYRERSVIVPTIIGVLIFAVVLIVLFAVNRRG